MVSALIARIDAWVKRQENKLWSLSFYLSFRKFCGAGFMTELIKDFAWWLNRVQEEPKFHWKYMYGLKR